VQVVHQRLRRPRRPEKWSDSGAGAAAGTLTRPAEMADIGGVGWWWRASCGSAFVPERKLKCLHSNSCLTGSAEL
jgi:hypothetical protein